MLKVLPLKMPWTTLDPFLFCVHHLDKYPAGNEEMGVNPSELRGRDIGMDFSGRGGWSMYHGESVPGFPHHPHRGFETVTFVRQGYIDHTDSTGAAARFGCGDVQWVTAGGGVVHSEMFPLIEREKGNTTELFQIWLNLPAKNKMAPPHFKMLWSEQVPRISHIDADGKRTEITLAAGALDGQQPPSPPPYSWAAAPENDVAIWQSRMQPGARWTLPPAQSESIHRVLYFFSGRGPLLVGEHKQSTPAGMVVNPTIPIELQAHADSGEDVELLLLQGRPIGEPVAQQGPFVMNTRTELMQAFQDYQRTQFGGWPWPSEAPTHPRDAGRFAKHGDGKTERPAAPAAAGTDV